MSIELGKLKTILDRKHITALVDESQSQRKASEAPEGTIRKVIYKTDIVKASARKDLIEELAKELKIDLTQVDLHLH